MIKSISLALLVALATLVVVDLLLSRRIADGEFQGMFVAPFGLTFTQQQAALLLDTGSTHSYGRFDAELGWSILPNGFTDLNEANSAGFRASREYAIAAPPGTERIAAFGDSFTHADGVSNDQTWEAVLESSVPNVEVLNFGVGGYGVDQAYLRYRRDGVDFHPDVVLIGVMVENILRSVSVFRPIYYHVTSGIGVKPRFRMDSNDRLELLPMPVSSLIELRAAISTGSLMEVLRETDFWLRRAPLLAYEQESPVFKSSLARIAYGLYENAGRDPKNYYEDTDNEPFRVTFEVVRSFYNEALSDGAERAFVVIFPNGRGVQSLIDGDEPYWMPLVDSLTAMGVDVIDVGAHLASVAGGRANTLFDRTGHYNAVANRAVARELRRRIFIP